MVSIQERKKDILSLIGSLDLSPTMYKNAVQKYESISTYLQNNGVQCNIYPQGSFALGTVVKPYKKDKDVNYDLDVICEISTDKNQSSPKEIKHMVGIPLKNSKRYSVEHENDTCWTVNFTDINNVGFSMDIVPAVEEDYYTKKRLTQKINNTSVVDQSIAITKGIENNYCWATNNPKGYKEWFDNINNKFLNYNREERRALIFEQYAAVFNTIEDIPSDAERSSLQIVIQILKRHRDIYFSNPHISQSARPISAIITTLATSIAENAEYNLDVFELLEYICKELSIYSNLQSMHEIRFAEEHFNKKLISRRNGYWYLINPVNPEDNLLDSWGKDTKASEAFFRWLNTVTKDFVEGLKEENDKSFGIVLENSLGRSLLIKNNLNKKYIPDIEPASNNIIISSKPWRKNDDNKL